MDGKAFEKRLPQAMAETGFRRSVTISDRKVSERVDLNEYTGSHKLAAHHELQSSFVRRN